MRNLLEGAKNYKSDTIGPGDVYRGKPKDLGIMLYIVWKDPTDNIFGSYAVRSADL